MLLGLSRTDAAIAVVVVVFSALAFVPEFAGETDKLFTRVELAAFDGVAHKNIYLAIVGDVFDVTSGAKHYARGKAYHHFAGRDASRAFATGESQGSGLTDSVAGLSDEQLRSIWDWHEFFANHEQYVRRGRVCGAYFAAPGDPEPEGFPHERLAQAEKRRAERDEWPKCNTKWSQAEGGEVWCTSRSGGVQRDWAGVPRLYGDGDACVCVPLARALVAHGAAPGTAVLRGYPGCASHAERCRVLPADPAVLKAGQMSGLRDTNPT